MSSFFSIQVAIEAYTKDSFREQLSKVISEEAPKTTQSMAEKRTFYKRIAGILADATPIMALGTWDYIADSAKAESEFETWASEIEGSIATQSEELGASHDEMLRHSSDRDYVLVTLMFLLASGSNSDLTCASRCDLPKEQYFTRMTFAHLIQTIPMLNFGSVEADAIYVVPGTQQDGLSWEDLHGEGYAYLKPLE